jgi:hypothetical protein
MEGNRVAFTKNLLWYFYAYGSSEGKPRKSGFMIVRVTAHIPRGHFRKFLWLAVDSDHLVVNNTDKCKIKQATKAQRGSKVIALLFL